MSKNHENSVKMSGLAFLSKIEAGITGFQDSTLISQSRVIRSQTGKIVKFLALIFLNCESPQMFQLQFSE